MNPKNLDRVTLVDEQDNVIGEMDKIEAHRGEAKRHRAISVYLFRKTSSGAELLIQQRSEKKIVGANLWANTVCGNVRPIEDYKECAYRRLKEELGITTTEIKPLYKFEYHIQCNAKFSEWEVDQVFIGLYDGEVSPNPDEAQDFSWVKWSELLEKSDAAKMRSDEYNTKTVKFEKELTLAPWFVWMLNDKHLIQKINL